MPGGVVKSRGREDILIYSVSLPTPGKILHKLRANFLNFKEDFESNSLNLEGSQFPENIKIRFQTWMLHKYQEIVFNF